MNHTVSAGTAGSLVTPAAAPRRALRSPWCRLRKVEPLLAVAIAILLLIALGTVFADVLAPYDPLRTSLRNRALLPSSMFWLGTDEQGRDILSRILFGFRATLLTSFTGMIIGMAIGGVIGLLAAYYRRLDMVLMRLIDVLLSFPAILIGLAIAGITGAGMAGIVAALAIATIGPMARIARSAALGVVSLEYIAGAKMVGLNDFRILTRYVLPNCMSAIIVYATLRFGQLILLAASLSFLGLGIAPPTPELGVMVSQGRALLLTSPHVALIPCAAILLLVLSLNLVGDALRDALDPKLKL